MSKDDSRMAGDDDDEGKPDGDEVHVADEEAAFEGQIVFSTS
jgi:hypothetical protein